MPVSASAIYLNPTVKVQPRDVGKSIFEAMLAEAVWSPDVIEDAKERALGRAVTDDTLCDMTIQFAPITDEVVVPEPTAPMPVVVEIDDSEVRVVRTELERAKILEGTVVPVAPKERKARFNKIKAAWAALKNYSPPPINTQKYATKIASWGYEQGLWDRWGK